MLDRCTQKGGKVFKLKLKKTTNNQINKQTTVEKIMGETCPQDYMVYF